MNTFLTSDMVLPEAADDAAPISRRGDPGSFNAQVAALGMGQTTAKAVQVDYLLLDKSRASTLIEARRRLSNSVVPALAKIKAKMGTDYTTEIVDTFAPASGRLFLVAFVTRVA